ncbi:MAG: 4-alpha-glucanotransferase [Deltaproteobacteria bacterium]|nr:4-alpha-glucanotransferase [Deltaproteobacteria bacterium]
MKIRTSGILLHPTALPGRFGMGDLGPGAYRFAGLLAEMGQQYWQILPINPTHARHGHSPYYSGSAFAGDPLWISPELLAREGWIAASDLDDVPDFPEERILFKEARAYKDRLMEKAFVKFQNGRQKEAVVQFVRETPWISDFTLFRVLTRLYGEPWSGWPVPIRDRDPEALKAARRRFQTAIHKEVFLQYLFFRQWHALKNHCNRMGVQLLGDMPIYLPFHSADVWSHPDLFKLTPEKNPSAVSGVPPDYFSRTGQLWGHPVYDWDALGNNRFEWWIRRMAHNLTLFDRIRIDHFRGWLAYWEVPAHAETAMNGKWAPAPGDRLLETLSRRFASLPLVAEDLGTITPDVRETMAKYDLPGMRLLLFAFGGDFPHGAFLPHNHIRNCVVYTGTHDNNTVRGWFETEAGDMEKKNLLAYMGHTPKPDEIHWKLIRLAMGSVANTAIIPLQDILGLGAEARMNRPAQSKGNWRWRAPESLLPPDAADRFAEMTRHFGRAPG